ncbi:MAG: rhomboid family intramembrane serine protease [Chloroflexota bacterium]
MAEERPSHPLFDNPPQQGDHPLSDAPPEKRKNEGQGIPIPLAANIPLITYALIAVNVGIFVLRYIMPELATSLLVAGYADTALILGEGQYYRLFTSMFLHFNEMHILFNSLGLYYIGSNLERLFGHTRYALIYFLGGLLGSVFPLFVSTGGLGASGAVFAIWGAEAVLLYRHRELFGEFGRQRLRSSLILMLVNFLAGFTGNALADATDSGVRIGNSAHLGGLFGGAALAWFIAPIYALRRKIGTSPDEPSIEVIDTNPLSKHIREVLFFCCGLLVLLLMAGIIRA